MRFMAPALGAQHPPPCIPALHYSRLMMRACVAAADNWPRPRLPSQWPRVPCMAPPSSSHALMRCTGLGWPPQAQIATLLAQYARYGITDVRAVQHRATAAAAARSVRASSIARSVCIACARRRTHLRLLVLHCVSTALPAMKNYSTVKRAQDVLVCMSASKKKPHVLPGAGLCDEPSVLRAAQRRPRARKASPGS